MKSLNANRGTVLHQENRSRLIMEVCFLVLLILYPMRHVAMGLDLWDTGYNYANFTYCSPEHMGEMWFFSTYLANVTGHLLTLLPGGGTLLGLNIFTGLFASALGVLGYRFCTRDLKISPVITFVGELVALSFCWCPTALLYNYLTYLLFLLCVIFLYRGLTKRKPFYLILAGAFLGTNVFVRFSNLPEAALILAVWAYGVIEAWERKKSGWVKDAFQKALVYTLWCLVGYVLAVAVMLGFLSLRYGPARYFSGILQLFAMTSDASDYQASSMLYGLIWPFRDSLFWVVRILFFLLCGCGVTMLSRTAVSFMGGGKKSRRFALLPGCLVVAAMVFWLVDYDRGGARFTSFYYRSYDPVFWPGVVVLLLCLLVNGILIFRRESRREEKLMAGMLILVVLLTSLGSNNNVYPSMNNLFLAAPCFLNEMLRFTAWTFRTACKCFPRLKWLKLDLRPFSLGLLALTYLCFVQIILFGINFSFCEGTGMPKTGYVITNNSVLKGISMSRERAQWLTEISAFAQEEELAGQEVILYGKIPALSFYLKMPAAFNPWSDLASYNIEVMKTAMAELRGDLEQQTRRAPVIIAEKDYAPYGPEGEKLPTNEEGLLGSEGQKWELLRGFMEDYGYEKSFENIKFVVWQADAFHE